jgi:teichuronic acid biosynthesis glycosyltransferase TuaG
MPCHNAEKTIGAAILSVIAQSLSNWELIVIEDGSTDGSRDVISHFSKKDQRIKCIFLDKPAGSAGPVRNEGIKQAEGRFIAFLDSDDLWMPDKLARQLDYMKQTGAGFSTTHTELIDFAGLTTGFYRPDEGVYNFQDMLKDNVVSTSAAIIDRNKYPEISFPDFKRAQDYACWMKILQMPDSVVHVCPQILGRYRTPGQRFWLGKFRQIYYRWLVHYSYLGRSLPQSFMDIIIYCLTGLNKTIKYKIFGQR